MKRPDKASLRTHTFDLPCDGKKCFASEKEALDAADFHMLENMNVELGVYQCAQCMYWHMTQLNKPAQKPRTRKK